MIHPSHYNTESVTLEEMLADPIFAKVAGAGPYRSTITEVIALCNETDPKILAALDKNGKQLSS